MGWPRLARWKFLNYRSGLGLRKQHREFGTMNRLLALLLFSGWAVSASAFPYVIDTTVNGADMAGIEVTVFLQDGSSDTATWAATGADSGAASGSGWTLSESGDTLNQPGLGAAWTLTNTGTASPITGFKIDAWVAQVFFDVYMDLTDPLDDVGTPGSSQGRPFTADNDKNPVYIYDVWEKYGTSITNANTPENTSAVTYLNPLSSLDLFGGLEVNFTKGVLDVDQSMRFMIDTDQVPEPPLYGLLALGLAGFAFRRPGRRAV